MEAWRVARSAPVCMLMNAHVAVRTHWYCTVYFNSDIIYVQTHLGMVCAWRSVENGRGGWGVLDIPLYLFSLNASGSLVEHAIAHWQNILWIIMCKAMAIVSRMTSGHSFV